MTYDDCLAALNAHPYTYTGLVLIVDDSPRYEVTPVGRAMLEGAK